MDNWQIYLMFSVNLIAVIVGISKGISVLVSVRDEVRDGLKDLRIAVGGVDPPAGLLGDVSSLKSESRTLREWSIDVAAQLGIRRPGGRS